MVSIFCHFFNVWRTYSVIFQCMAYIFFHFQLISINTHNRMSSDQSKKRKISISTKIEIVESLQTPGSSLKKAM